MAENDVTISFKVDETGAVNAFDDLDRKLDGVKDQAEKASGGFSKFQASIVSVNAAIDIARTAFNTAAVALADVVAATRQGAEIDDISNAFERLSEQAGTTADTLLNELNAATKDTISNTELMRIANEGLLAGLDPNAFDEVAKAARSYADTIGGDAKQELEAFIQGLARGDDRFLKSRGILLDNDAAFREYAASVGKAADKLTELEKAEALKAAATRALIANTSKLGEANKDIADSLDTITKRLADARDEFFKAIANNKALGEAFDQLGQAMADLPIKELAEALSQLITVTVRVTQAAVAMFGAFRDGAEFALAPYQLVTRKLEEAQRSSAAATDLATTAIGKHSAALAPLTKALASIRGIFTQGLNAAIDMGAQLWRQWGEAVTNSIPADEGKLQRLREIDSQIVELNKHIAELTVREEEAAAREARANQKLGALGSGSGFGDALSKSFSDLLENAGTKLGQGLGSALQNAIAAGINGQFESSAGIEQGLSDLGATIGSQFGPVGEAIGAQLGKLTFDLFHSNDSPGTTFRKEVDKFFADAFEANHLQVIIDGALKEITDLDFGGDNFGNAKGGFFAVFDSMEQSARESFKGVGAAFAELTGQGQEFANNLAAALSTNVGGSLNNLQLLVQATGKSFEELKGGIQEAFLDGKLSALEAQTALNGLARVAQKGIPDALGAVEQAFDNIKAAGVKGGRALIDALQDVGFEAKELGLTTFAQVQERLAATGKFSAGEIQQVFNALATNGIDTIDELTSAGLDPLLATLSQLQAEDFGFARAVESAQELVEQVNKIPDRLEKNLVFNVRTNLDNNTKQASQDGVFRSAGVGQAGEGFAT